MDSKEHQLGARWIPVSERLPAERNVVDVWLEVRPSARSMGWSDSFRVADAFRKGDLWFHRVERGEEKQLVTEYVTHWMAPPLPPLAASESQEQRSTESAVASDLRLAAQIRNLALEEAAVICDNYARNYEGWAGGNDVAEGLAEAIRAAKQ